jgi:hypothetical protein
VSARRGSEALFGIQSWIALPQAYEESDPAFALSNFFFSPAHTLSASCKLDASEEHTRQRRHRPVWEPMELNLYSFPF